MNWIKTNGAENVPAHSNDVLIYIPGRGKWTKASWWPLLKAWCAEDDDGGEVVAPEEVSHYCEIAPPGDEFSADAPQWHFNSATGAWTRPHGWNYITITADAYTGKFKVYRSGNDHLNALDGWTLEEAQRNVERAIAEDEI